MSQNGKGDKQRPAQITPEQLAERWARTFGGMEPADHRAFEESRASGIRAMRRRLYELRKPEPKPENGRP